MSSTAHVTGILGAGVMGETLLSGPGPRRAAGRRAAGRREAPRARRASSRRSTASPSSPTSSATKRADTLALVVKPQDMAGAARRDRRRRCGRASSWSRSPPASPRPSSSRGCPPAPPSSASCPTPRPWSTRAWPRSRAGSHCDEEHLAIAEELLGSTGRVLRVPEKQMDAVTAISGSGPAYLFFVVEAMIEAGVHLGLPRVDRDRAGRPDRGRLGEDAPRDRRPPGRAARAGHLARRHHRRRAARARDPQGAGRVPGRDGGRAQPLVRAGRGLLTAEPNPDAAPLGLASWWRRHAWTVGAGSWAGRLVTLLGAVVGVALMSGSDQPVTAHAYPRWQQLAAPPLVAARRRARGPAWATGCSCSVASASDGVALRDGASYDLRTETWRQPAHADRDSGRDRGRRGRGRGGGAPRRAARRLRWWRYDPDTTPGRGCAACLPHAARTVGLPLGGVRR